MKCQYLFTCSLDPAGADALKPVLNAFAIPFGDRWPEAETC